MSQPVFVRPAGAADLVVSPTSGRRLPRRSHLYDAVIDLLLREPTLTQKDIAARLGRSSAWVSYIVRCDAFVALYEERRKEHNVAKTLAITEGLQKVAEKSLEILNKRLEENPASLPTQLALEVTDKMLERLGYGVKLPGISVGQSVGGMALSAEDFALAQSIVRQVEVTHSTKGPDGVMTQTVVRVASDEKSVPTIAAHPHPVAGAAKPEPTLEDLLCFGDTPAPQDLGGFDDDNE